MTPPCERCRDTGRWQYDDHHTQPCPDCCPHNEGVWMLTHEYGQNVAGNWCCRRGCGKMWTPTEWVSANPTPTLHDAITFAIRDNFSPRLWADADDIAVVVIGAVARYRGEVGEDVFLDNILAWDDGSLGDGLNDD